MTVLETLILLGTSTLASEQAHMPTVCESVQELPAPDLELVYLRARPYILWIAPGKSHLVVEIYDLSGRRCWEGEMEADEGLHYLALPELQPGVFTLKTGGDFRSEMTVVMN